MSDGEMASERELLTALFIRERCRFLPNIDGTILAMKVGDAFIPLKSFECRSCGDTFDTFKEIPNIYCDRCAPRCLRCGSEAPNGLFNRSLCSECFVQESMSE